MQICEWVSQFKNLDTGALSHELGVQILSACESVKQSVNERMNESQRLWGVQGSHSTWLHLVWVAARPGGDTRLHSGAICGRVAHLCRLRLSLHHLCWCRVVFLILLLLVVLVLKLCLLVVLLLIVWLLHSGGNTLTWHKLSGLGIAVVLVWIGVH